MRICVIFNPAARGNKAKRFRRHLDEMAQQSVFKATSAPGDARRFAATAIAEGFDLIVAAGGDGTVNEVLNGFADAPEGFARARLGGLPRGTVNVFAREFRIPARLESAGALMPQVSQAVRDALVQELAATRLELFKAQQIASAKVISANGYETRSGSSPAGRTGSAVAGLLSDVRTYQGLDPAMLGRRHKVVIGKHSGLAAIKAVCGAVGLDVDGAIGQAVLARVKNIAKLTKTLVPEARVRQLAREEISAKQGGLLGNRE